MANWIIALFKRLFGKEEVVLESEDTPNGELLKAIENYNRLVRKK